jgi:hypothetical protein
VSGEGGREILGAAWPLTEQIRDPEFGGEVRGPSWTKTLSQSQQPESVVVALPLVGGMCLGRV